MKLHKALKVKNRLAGELVKLQDVLRRENARRNDNVSKINCREVFDNLNTTRNKLNQIKTAIAKANVGIYQAIDKMSELKSFITFLETLPTTEGEQIQYLGGDQQVKYMWSAFLNKENVENQQLELQKQINDLQDQIDEYNAKTDVDYQD